jgi:hypothetical protein
MLVLTYNYPSDIVLMAFTNNKAGAHARQAVEHGNVVLTDMMKDMTEEQMQGLSQRLETTITSA